MVCDGSALSSGFLMACEIGGRFLDDQPVKGVYRQAGYAACSALKQDVLCRMFYGRACGSRWPVQGGR
jgi:hypothetical protein